jgi:hypothetical protein
MSSRAYHVVRTLYSVIELSNMLHLAPGTIRAAIRRGELAAIRISPPGTQRVHHRVTEAALSEWLGLRHAEAASPAPMSGPAGPANNFKASVNR